MASVLAVERPPPNVAVALSWKKASMLSAKSW
jgi:hypothetical protein